MRARGPLLAAIASAVAIVLVIAILIVPKLGQIRTAKDMLNTALQQQSTLESQLKDLKDTETRAKAIRTELDLLGAAVPEESQLPDLIRMLNDTADQSGVDFMSIAPAQPSTVNPASSSVGAVGTGATATPSGSPPPAETITPVISGATLPVGISIMPLTITIKGAYFAVDEYLFRLETLPRISKVTNLGLVGGDSYPQLVLTITVNFYTTDTSAGPGSQIGPQPIGGQPAVVPSGSVPGSTSPGGSNPVPTGTLPG